MKRKKIWGVTYILIPTNNSSDYVGSDVLKIVHVPTRSRIEVHLQANFIQTCQNPLLKGRISGWSLLLVDFETTINNNSTNNNNVLVGSYDPSALPVSGKYYLEVVVLMCERYDSNTILDLDIRHVCLYKHEVVAHHEITQQNSIINVVKVDRSQATTTTTATTATTMSSSM